MLGLAIAAAGGCYTGSAVDSNRGPSNGADANGTEPGGGSSGNPDPGGGLNATGLPCDVAELMAKQCTSCHGARLTGGAQNRLVTYDDVVKGAESSLQRMKSAERPMPPGGKLSADRIAVLENWIKAGKPKGTCGQSGTLPDGGTGPGTPEVESVCTSGAPLATTQPSRLMFPGGPCVTCHLQSEWAATFKIGGTVYPTLHEPTACRGASDIKVLLIDANGDRFEATTNASGNFVFDDVSVYRPYKAMIVKNNIVREMKSLQYDGDCNRCHSEWGDEGAPGRILTP